MYMIWLVLNHPEMLDKVQKAWEDIGIHSATFIESSGFFRRKESKKFVSTRYVLPSLSDVGHNNNVTIFCIANDEEQVQAALDATEKVIGDLSQPNSGVFAAWPLSIVKGVRFTEKDDEGRS